MRILSININDFGGINEHLMRYKYFHEIFQKECIEKVTVYEDRLTVEFKSELGIDVEG